MTPEEARALDIAREMARAGIPIFVCPPNPYKPGKYFFKAGWPNVPADPAVLDEWQEGWGVGAVGGLTADFLDMDPRSGGIESREVLKNAGEWPLSFGQQSTPSGGTHDVISASGIGKETGFMPGLDLQGGMPVPDAEGDTHRGFVWLAPTVGVSKETGELVPYRWVHEPDLSALDEWRASDGSCTDESVRGVTDRVLSKRTTRVARAPDAFDVASERAEGDGGSSLFGAPAGAARAFTMEQAKEFVRPHLDALREAKPGNINEMGMRATLAIEHFVPAFWSPAEAGAIILDNLSHTAYDKNGPSDWTADQQFIQRLDGRRPVKNSWKAQLATVSFLAPAPDPGPIVTGRLRKAMLKRSQIHELPKPEPLIEHVLFRESIAVLSGKFGTYKSFVAVGMACSLASGRPWMGYNVPEAVPVIYAAAEGAYGLRMRIDAWEKRYGEVPDDFYLIPISARITNRDDMAELGELVGETGAKLVVFDTLHASTPGADEDKASDMGPVVDALRMLREKYGVAALLPHHTGHEGKRARGSSSIEDDADVSFVIDLAGEDRGPETQRVMKHRKTKDEALLPPMPLKLELVEGTGSGYVRIADAFEQAAGEERAPDIGQEKTIQEPQEWTKGFTHPSAEMQRRILQTLADVGGTLGRTESQVQGLIAERWHNRKVGRGPGQLNRQAYQKAWAAVVEMGCVLRIEGQRYGIDPLSILGEKNTPPQLASD